MITRNSPTKELESVARRFWQPNPYPDADRFCDKFHARLKEAIEERWPNWFLPTLRIYELLMTTALSLWQQEERHLITFFEEKPADPVELGRYRDNLIQLIKLSDDDPRRWTNGFIEHLVQILIPFLAAIPQDVWFAPPDAAPQMRMLDALGEQFPTVLMEMIRALFKETPFPYDSLSQLRAQITQNTPNLARTNDYLFPDQHHGSNDEILNIYLQKTPLRDLFLLSVPIHAAEEAEKETEEESSEPDIDERAWYQHCLLLAGTGGGKTNAIRWRMVQVLFQVERGEASLVLMEPKGVLTRELIQFVRVSGLEARLTIIEPGDPRIAVNLFENDDHSPQGINAAVARISRIFSTITLDLTAFQRTALTFALRAIFAVPGPVNLRTLMGVLRNGIKDLPVQNLSFAVQDFFDNEYKPGMAGARAGAEIISRLNGLLADPVFESLFAADRTTFDIGREMQSGKVIVVNSSAAAPLYSRFWVEEVSRTIQHRLALPFSHRMPSTFIIDEAQNFIANDLHFAEILDMAREARIGMLIAAHHMGQITNDHVRNSLYTNTALKFVARTSADIFNLCRSMGETEPSFLNTLPQYHFGFFGPNMRSATEVKLPLVEFTRSTPHQTTTPPGRKTRARDPDAIVGFNERPPEMEAWRLDHSYKPPSENDYRPQPIPEPKGDPTPDEPSPHADPKPNMPTVEPKPPTEGSPDWHC